MARSYRHLTYEQRCQLYSLNNRGDSQKEMAVALNVSTGTISRELRRNRAESGDYHYTQAQKRARQSRQEWRAECQRLEKKQAKLLEEKIEEITSLKTKVQELEHENADLKKKYLLRLMTKS